MFYNKIKFIYSNIYLLSIYFYYIKGIFNFLSKLTSEKNL